MSVGLVSGAERVFILDGAEAGLRCDGRAPDDYRPIRVETGLVAGAQGSARLRLGPNEVLVAVKASLRGGGSTSSRAEGRLEFFADASAVGRAEWEGRGGEDVALRLAAALQDAYAPDAALHRSQLAVGTEGAFAWCLHVDVVVLEMGGALFDAASLAVKAALHDLRLPRLLLLFNQETELHEAEVAEEEPLDRLSLEGQAPVLVHVAKLRSANVLDPTDEEELVSSASVLVGVLPGPEAPLTLVHKAGSGALDPDSVQEMMAMGKAAATRLHEALAAKLKEEEARDEAPLGFLSE